MRSKNIFENVIYGEDSLTELFCNLLQFPVFRVAFCKVLSDRLGFKVSFSYDDINSQFETAFNGRPDIIIENGKCTFFIEVKTSNTTPLTKNQPVGYTKFLQANYTERNRALIFLIPKGYQHGEEIIARHKISKASIPLRIIYWEEILQIRSKIKVNAFLDHFFDLIQAWYESHIVTFSAQELKMIKTKDFAVSFKKLMHVHHFARTELKRMAPYYLGDSENELMMYFKNRTGKFSFFFGIWYDLFAEKGIPMCIGTEPQSDQYDPKAVREFKRVFKKEIILYKNEPIIPLGLDVLGADSNTDLVISKIKQVYDTTN